MELQVNLYFDNIICIRISMYNYSLRILVVCGLKLPTTLQYDLVLVLVLPSTSQASGRLSPD